MLPQLQHGISAHGFMGLGWVCFVEEMPLCKGYGLNMENMQIFVFESIHAPAARIQMPRTSTRYLCLACMN
jgi:hypothetical protein